MYLIVYCMKVNESRMFEKSKNGMFKAFFLTLS